MNPNREEALRLLTEASNLIPIGVASQTGGDTNYGTGWGAIGIAQSKPPGSQNEQTALAAALTAFNEAKTEYGAAKNTFGQAKGLAVEAFNLLLDTVAL